MHIDNLISGIEEEEKEMSNAQPKQKELYTGAKHKTETFENTETEEKEETENNETEQKEESEE